MLLARKKENTIRRKGLMFNFDIEFFRKKVKVRATDLMEVCG